MDKAPYPVGTVCRVRSKEDMIAEFGSIAEVPYGFVDSMKYMCGQTFTVKAWRVNVDRTVRYWSEEGIENNWSISH